MRFGSVCSGIEAASVAWHPLGWKAAWLSEIEPFPSAVLAHHYPDVPNLGDMTALPERILSGEVEAPDVFCGGTPCQAFSVAGLRNSLDDARGNLSLTFVGIANAIDHVRSVRSDDPAIIFWENVPGVLSTKDNAFGCFLGALAGEVEALEPAGGKWTNAGCVSGPQRTVAWRVLDAQYFGVAQRRRRVFVIASARDDFNSAEVLFESESLRRDTAPSREARQETATGIASGAPFGGMSPVAGTLAANTGGLTRPAGNANELDFCVPVAHPIPFDTTQITSPANYSKPQAGDPCHPLAAGAHAPAVAQPMVLMDQGGSVMNVEHNMVGTLRRETHGHEPVVMQPVAFDGYNQSLSDTCQTIRADKSDGDHVGMVMQSMAVRRLTPVECERLQGFPDGYTNIPWRKKDESPDGPRYKALGNSWAVPVVAWIGKRINEAVK
jgi:DNA (cytosine-5)-methyltransferase 1